MPFTPHAYQRITGKLREINPEGLLCQMCSNRTWTVADGVVVHVLSYGSANFQPPVNNLPCIALMCQVCGHTVFFNLLMLGLGDLLSEGVTFGPRPDIHDSGSLKLPQLRVGAVGDVRKP